jgi:hypothetical protein
VRKKSVDVAIRMIDIATAVCWVILVIFSVSAVYSVKDLEFNVGEPQIGTTSDGRILFSLSMNISNGGYYDIGSFNVTTRVLDQSGSAITEGSTFISTIRRGEKLSVLHNMTLDMNRLLQLSQTYLFNDTQLKGTESVGMSLAGLIPVQASGNFIIPWGAPLYDLGLEEPQYSMVNSSYMQVTVPMSFDNHAFVDVNGEALTRMFNNADQLIGFNCTKIESAKHSQYDGEIGLYVETSSITRTGRFELELQTPLFSYGPMVVPYG